MDQHTVLQETTTVQRFQKLKSKLRAILNAILNAILKTILWTKLREHLLIAKTRRVLYRGSSVLEKIQRDSKRLKKFVEHTVITNNLLGSY